MSEHKFVYSGTIVPEFTTKETELFSANIGTKLINMSMALIGGVVLGGIFVGIGFGAEMEWLKWFGIIVGGLIIGFGFFKGGFLKIAECPYCSEHVGKTLDDSIQRYDENEKVECMNCHEWLISHKGKLKAFTHKDVERKSWKYLAPVYEGGVWQNECLVCGQHVTRTQDLKKTNLDGVELLTGTVSVASATVANLPYCDKHWNAVKLKIKDDYLRLTFEDFDARRRYIVINKGKKAIKITKKKKKKDQPTQ